MGNPGTTTTTLGRFTAARAAVAGLPSDVGSYRSLSESDLLAANQENALIRRGADSAAALIAGELAHRSRHELGGEGLAHRAGFRTVEKLLQQTGGMTGHQAVTAVKAGRLLVEVDSAGTVDELTGEIATPTQPWLAPVASAIAAGTLSTSAAEVIGLGLGAPNSAVSVENLLAAAMVLVTESIAGLHPDRLRLRARELRDDMDVAGVKIREDELDDARALVHFPLPAGGGKAILTMGILDYARFVQYADRAVSPKLRGVRFVNEQQKLKAAEIEADPRTVKQLGLDAIMQLLAQGAEFDTSHMLGTGGAVIRITVAEDALTTGIGVGRIDGNPDPVSLDTVKRLMESGSTIRMGFDPAGNVLDLEKEQRLFSRRQKEALGVRDGGCMDPHCDAPAAHTEAHHILHWTRDGGKTLIANGILLCKFDHLRYHNDGYEIIRDKAGGYWLIPPTKFDPDQTPIPMPSKSRALKDLNRYRKAS